MRTPDQRVGPGVDPSRLVDGAQTSAPADGKTRTTAVPDGALALDKPFAARPSKGLVPAPPAPKGVADREQPRFVAPKEPAAVTGFEAGKSVELPGERTQFTRVFKNPDGTRTAKFGSHPLNYRAPDLSWQPIDPTLVAAGGGRWRNRADSVPVSFGGRSSDADLVGLDLGGGRSVAFGLAGATDAVGTVSGGPAGDGLTPGAGSAITYRSARPDTDVTFELLPGSGVKEKIVLASPEAASSWVFPLRLTGLTPRLTASGEVELVDKLGEIVAWIPHGFMVDSKVDARSGDPARSEAVSYELVRRGSGWDLVVTADRAWLSDPVRVYPVTVDPSVHWWNYSTSADTFVQTGYSTSQQNDVQLKVGTWNGGSDKAATYLHFGQVDDLLRHAIIHNAQLYLYNIWSYSCGQKRTVTVHPVTQSWSAGSIAAYPGPSYGTRVATSAAFAYGYIPSGATTSSCPANWTSWSGKGIDLGSGGRALIQGWVDGTKANNGLTVRTSITDSYSWKKFASRETPNGPFMTITYNPYNAGYAFPEATPVISPTVDPNTAGYVNVNVTNKGRDTWTPSNGYKLSYGVYDAAGQQLYHIPAETVMPSNVGYNQTVTVHAKINPLPVGTWYVRFDMQYATSSAWAIFSDYGIARAAPLKVVVGDPPPELEAMYPYNNHRPGTLTPQLYADANNPDGWPANALTYTFTLCKGTSPNWDWCTNSPTWQTSPVWQVPAGTMTWGQEYFWSVSVTDGSQTTSSPLYAIRPAVAQPAITSHLSGADAGREFSQSVGNYTTTVTDASVPVIGPPLSVVRTYNSLDPRTTGLFGAGWSTRYDMRATADTDGSGNVVVTYPDGRQVRFGRNADGTFAPPPGQFATFAAVSGGGWELMDKSSTVYDFNAAGRLTSVTDNRGRAQTLTYDGAGKLTTVTTAGRSLHFTFTGSHVSSVSTDPVGGSGTSPLTWTYSYSGDRLTGVCAPGAGTACASYGYGTGSHYRSVVLDGGPSGFWRLGESSGSTAGSEVALNAGADAGTYTAATLGVTGALAGTTDKAARFAGAGWAQLPANSVTQAGPYVSLEAWFKTTGPGAVIGYQSGLLSAASMVHWVPAVYVGTDGKLRGQFWNGGINPIVSAGPVNDGAWHHAVLTAGGGTQTLYLDGAAVGTRSGAVDHQDMKYVQAGCARVASNWPATLSATGNFCLTGDVDEVAIYQRQLGQTEVTAHYAARLAAQQLTSNSTAQGRTHAQVTYDTEADRVATVTDQNGGTWQLGAPVIAGEAGAATATVTIADPAGNEQSQTYDTARSWRLITETDQLGQVTTYGYDTGGNVAGTTDRNGHTTAFWRDERGNILATTRCRDANTCYAVFAGYYLNAADPFDPRNDLLIWRGDGRSSGYLDVTYNTDWEYDQWGQQVKEFWPEVPGGPAQWGLSFTYTTGTEAAAGGGTQPPGLLKTTTDARGNLTSYAYSSAGDLLQVTGPTGLVTGYAYDKVGRRTAQTVYSDVNTAGTTTSYGYDAAGRLATVTGHGQYNWQTATTHTAATSYTYDHDGNTLTQTAADLTGGDTARTTTWTYDNQGHVATQTDAVGAVTSYGYDAFGHVTTTTSPAGQAYTYAYTDRGQLETVTLNGWTGSPAAPEPAHDVELAAYTYDEGGRLAAKSDAMGRVTGYRYYDDDRVAQVIASDAVLNGAIEPRDVVLADYVYDGAGNLTRQTTGGGKTRIDSTYDPKGRLTATVLDPAGLARRTAYAYDLAGNVTSVTRSHTASTRVETATHTYNAGNQRTSTTVDNGADDLTTTYTVNNLGLVAAVTDPRGTAPGANAADYTTSLSYDSIGRLTRITQPQVTVDRAGFQQTENPYVSYSYNTFDERTHEFDGEWRQSITAYDKAGRVVSVAAPSYTPPGGMAIIPTTQYAYDTAGNLATATDPRGNATTYTYDKLGRQVTRTDPLVTGQASAGKWTYTYDLGGEVLATVDPTGARVEATYDDLGRTITNTEVERRPTTASYTTRYGYDDAGNRTSVTGPTGGQVSSAYNAAGEPVTLVDPTSRSMQAAYDLAGRVTKMTYPTGVAIAYAYDLAGRPTTVTDLIPSGTTVRTRTFGYDRADNPTIATNGNGHTTTRTFDAANRMTSLTEPVTASTSITTGFGYDSVGAITRLTDGRGNTTITTYNSLNLVETVTEPFTDVHPDAVDRVWTAAYDAVGNAVHVAAPGGVTVTSTYDQLGRLTRQAGAGAEAATTDRTFGYDLAGRLVAESTPGGTIATTYNDRGLPLTVTAPGQTTASYTYDAGGRTTARTDAAGTATYTYDAAGRTATAIDGLTNTTQTYGYDALGRLTDIQYGNTGGHRTLGYDTLDRLTSDALTNPAGTATVASTTYGYDNADNLTSKTTTGYVGAGTTTYTYDRADRVISTTPPGGSPINYTWDAAGNRTQAGANSYTFDQRNRLTAGAGASYTYTARGTLATATSTAGGGVTTTHAYTNDAFGQLITDSHGSGITYAYDAAGRLATRSHAGTTTSHGYNLPIGNDPVAVTATGSTPGQTLIGRGLDGNALSLRTGSTNSLAATDLVHGDLVGTSTNGFATLAASAAYAPFGEATTNGATGTLALGYQGEYTDPTSGAVNMHARWYGPANGSFASRDDASLAPDPSIQANRYTYANGNPLTYTDTTGHSPDPGFGCRISIGGPTVGYPCRSRGGSRGRPQQIVGGQQSGCRYAIGCGRSLEDVPYQHYYHQQQYQGCGSATACEGPQAGPKGSVGYGSSAQLQQRGGRVKPPPPPDIRPQLVRQTALTPHPRPPTGAHADLKAIRRNLEQIESRQTVVDSGQTVVQQPQPMTIRDDGNEQLINVPAPQMQTQLINVPAPPNPTEILINVPAPQVPTQWINVPAPPNPTEVLITPVPDHRTFESINMATGGEPESGTDSGTKRGPVILGYTTRLRNMLESGRAKVLMPTSSVLREI
ncbi:RHS repeat-associated core domain-containing protein [Phytohabitans rumicis]|uniref:Uncharacterized protein n=1 Tax=Phytohabitans rumicis TaxID=1076125 RepID=A0A6V8L8L9_9ACTN|nr:RHS repeat-associated core domain-containing protein [Phytohabitans rumicis]GFJ92634.1 hypothetical protein Prum_062760 [Phytohabitans rumicis]